MSYRIDVHPDAGAVLRTLRGHVVQKLGRLLADLADLAEPIPALKAGASSPSRRLECEDFVLFYDVDRDQRMLSVRSVRPLAREEAAAPA